MNFRVIIKMLGSLLIIEAAGMLLSLIVSLCYNEHDKAAFIASIIITAAAGFALYRIPKRKNTLRIKEGMVIVAMGWVMISIFGSLPFIISGSIPSFTDSLFETVSGFTTTGATILGSIEGLPRGILFWRSFTHWIGGMGIVVFTVAVLPALGVGGFRIIQAESPGPSTEKIVPRIKDTAKILYTVYLGLTVLETILLMLGGMSLYDALIHTFGTVGTGGFSSRNASIGAYESSYIQIVIAVFMVFAGTNFALYYAIYRRKWRELSEDREVRLYLGIILVSTILIALNIDSSIYKNIGTSLKHAFFQVSSIISTTGYMTVDFDQWPTFSKSILFLLMFMGGCAGSTAGAIKVVRILVLWKLIKRELIKIVHPRAVIPVKIGQKALSPEIISGISSFVVLYIFIFVSGSILVSLEGIDMISAFSSVAATLGNIGPGFGLVGPVQNFAGFSIPCKCLFSGLMLMGRLELFTIIVLFSRKFWTEEW